MATTQDQNAKELLTRAHGELNVLYEVSCAMRTTLELNHILHIILTGVTSHTGLGYNRALLYLVNANQRCLECKMAIGPESGEHADQIWRYIENSNQKLDDLIQVEKISDTPATSALYKSLKDLTFSLDPQGPALLTKAFVRAAPWQLDQPALAGYGNDPLLQAFKTNELVIMPLRAKGRVNGLIVADNLYTQKPITRDDLKIFTMLADQAGLAIENSHLYEMIVHKSHTDSITNLWNHGYFQEKLSAAIQLSREQNTALSLAMIDIDDFKKLNDAYGHQQGDFVLRELAKVLTKISRPGDCVCRYGGEEFALILDGANKEQGKEIAERIRVRIEQSPLRIHPVDHPLYLTASIGVATFPEDASCKEDLIAKADKAMYIAKFSGKNQVCGIQCDD